MATAISRGVTFPRSFIKFTVSIRITPKRRWHILLEIQEEEEEGEEEEREEGFNVIDGSDARSFSPSKVHVDPTKAAFVSLSKR